MEVVPCWIGSDLHADLLSIEYDRMLAFVLEQDEEKAKHVLHQLSTGVSIGGCEHSHS